jgi:hypothetical protein
MADALPEYDARCKSKTDLENFYDMWLTYISQIFGDEQVRELIQKINPNLELELKSIIHPRGQPFAGESHHIVSYKKNKKMIICSADQGYQNIDVHKGDVLCQSYALLNYFGIKMDETDTDIGHWRNQMKMIQIYENFLSNSKFMKELEKLIIKISKENPVRWYLYNRDQELPFNFQFNHIVTNIKEVLKLWGSYGYWTFIKNGSCMKKEYFDGLKLLYGNNQTLGSRKRSSSASGSAVPSGTSSLHSGSVRSSKRNKLLPVQEGSYKKKRKTFKKTSRKIQRKRKSSRQKRV